MNTVSKSAPTASDAPDPAQKKRLIIGVLVWAAGWGLGIGLVPVVNGMNLSDGVTATLNGILLIGFPKLFLVFAVAIMGKPGFAYLKRLIASKFARFAPPATVSPMRYRVGLVMFVTLVALGALGPYVARDALPLLQENRRAFAAAGDVLLLVSLFVLGGDFWDKLRALFIRDAKVVFNR